MEASFFLPSLELVFDPFLMAAKINCMGPKSPSSIFLSRTPLVFCVDQVVLFSILLRFWCQ
jgi:hypothetical protein